MFFKKLKSCPSRSRNDYQGVLKNKVSEPARQLLDKLTSVSTTAQKKFAGFRKGFDQPTSKYSAFFSKCLFFEGPSGDVDFSYGKLDEKNLPKVDFFRSMCKIDIKKRLFLKNIFFQKDPMDT